MHNASVVFNTFKHSETYSNFLFHVIPKSLTLSFKEILENIYPAAVELQGHKKKNTTGMLVMEGSPNSSHLHESVREKGGGKEEDLKTRMGNNHSQFLASMKNN